MSGRANELPDPVRRKALAQGTEGRQWLNSLDSLIAQLERDWDMTIVSTLDGGSEAYVAAVQTADSQDAILKIQMPGLDFTREITTLLVANGRGYARLLKHDPACRAMLLERLGRQLRQMGWSIKTQIETICITLQQAWIPVPANLGLQSTAEKARTLSDFIVETWEELSRPCSKQVISQALLFAEIQAQSFDTDSAVLVHGDAHSSNTLESSSQHLGDGPGFKLIDPDGLFGDRAYDLSVPMRDWSEELLAGDPLRLGRERCAYLSSLTGVDPEAIWQWGFIERVSTGLLMMQVGFEQQAENMLKVAEAWASPDR